MRVAGVAARVWRMFQPCFGAEAIENAGFMEGSEIWFSFRRIWISIPPDFDFVPTGFDFVPTDFEFLPPVLGGWKGAWRGPASALRCWEESAKALSQCYSQAVGYAARACMM